MSARWGSARACVHACARVALFACVAGRPQARVLVGCLDFPQKLAMYKRYRRGVAYGSGHSGFSVALDWNAAPFGTGSVDLARSVVEVFVLYWWCTAPQGSGGKCQCHHSGSGAMLSMSTGQGWYSCLGNLEALPATSSREHSCGGHLRLEVQAVVPLSQGPLWAYCALARPVFVCVPWSAMVARTC